MWFSKITVQRQLEYPTTILIHFLKHLERLIACSTHLRVGLCGLLQFKLHIWKQN